MKTYIYKYFFLLLLHNISLTFAANNFEECEAVFQKNKHDKIVEKCLNLKGNSNTAKNYKTVATLFSHVSYDRINSIFYSSNLEKISLVNIHNYLNPYSEIEKRHLKNAYIKLKQNTQVNSSFFKLIFAKIAYINILYSQIHDGGIISSETIEKEKEFKAKVYLPSLIEYAQTNPNDKEALYLIGKEGVKAKYKDSGNSTQHFYSVQIKEYYKYMEKSASLGFGMAQEVVGLVTQWETHQKQLRSIADSA